MTAQPARGEARAAGEPDAEGRRRVVIEGVRPQIDCGRFPVKRVTGETVAVEADIFVDGHDQIAAQLLYRKANDAHWRETPLAPIGNDRWRGEFRVEALGRYRYTVAARADRFLSWRHELERWRDPDDVARALAVGAELVAAAAARAAGAEGTQLRTIAARLVDAEALEARVELATSPALEALMLAYADRTLETVYERELEVVVDRPLARFSAWYELFPRSTGEDGAHGTFATTASRLPYIAALGFDIVYLPPIHPIGTSHRKGPNNSLTAGLSDPGSPWAIGAAAGGHKAVHSELGTLEDFRALRAAAHDAGLEIALDLAFQCSPDHPYVREHPEWFRQRPDGTIQHAENPPKKYQDIYPFDFETPAWRELWFELSSVVEFWIGQGVTIFRVDNPHTKPFAFWEWLIEATKARHPETLFLAEAFSRPRVMQRLAKLGFTQSYTYFTWRNTKQELVEYLRELTVPGCRDYFRPSFWPNTPDILHEYLQFGGRPAFVARLVLAATLAASYGIYGPAFELLEHEPREPGSEEYLHSEKYEIRRWNTADPATLAPLIARLNGIRRDNPALQSDEGLAFHAVDNEQLLCYSKRTAALDNIVLVVVTLDPHHPQSGFVSVPLAEWGIGAGKPYQVHDLLSGARYLWHGARNFVALDPQRSPAQIFRLRRHVGTEKEFDYFL